jgi:hypothetical protein
VKGKTFIYQHEWGHDPSVNVLLETGGLTRNDVNFIDMKATEGATAFIRGEGDIYTGDLPNTMRLIEMGNKKIIGAKELPGPYMQMWVNFWMRKDLVQNDEPTALRILSTWYRVADTLNSGEWEKPLEIMRKWVNRYSGANFTLEQGRYVQLNVSSWLTFEEALRKYFEGTPSVWMRRLQFLIEEFEKQGKINPGVVKADELSKIDYLFYKLLQLKIATEMNLSDIEKKVSGKTGREIEGIMELVEKAKSYYRIRDYVDSEAISAVALKAATNLK